MSGSPPLLGRLEPVPLRTVWSREDHGFTPWLAEPANLDLLAATLGLQLELKGTETESGPSGPTSSVVKCARIGWS